MSVFKKKDLVEMVGGDISAGGSDRNPVNNSEIETGPVEKPYNDNSDYEKGGPPTSDRVFGRYRQNIPWFAVYSYRSSSGRGLPISESNGVVLTKEEIEKKIKEDLVKKSSKDRDVIDKNYDGKTEKIIDTINDVDLSDEQLEKIKKAVLSKITKKDA